MILRNDYLAISPDHRARRLPRPAAVAGAFGVAAVAIAACSAGPGARPGPSSAQKAIKLAASRSQDVNTLTARLSELSSGTSHGGLTGAIQIQLKPTTRIAATFALPGKKSSTQLAEILTGKAIYIKDPVFTKTTGKPWVTVQISQLSTKAGVSVASLLQNLEGSNPLDQTRLFTASKDVKVIGTRLVGHVATTEYAGTYSPAAAFAQLPSNLRRLLGPALRAMGTNRVHFQVWIDRQHLIRKARDTETVNGHTFTTTFDVTAVNKPVRITLPPAGQVAPMPKI